MEWHFGPSEWLASFRQWLRGRRRRLKSKIKQRLTLAQRLARTLLQITVGLFLVGCSSIGPGRAGGTMLSQGRRTSTPVDQAEILVRQAQSTSYVAKLSADERVELTKQLFAVAKSSPNPLLRADAVSALGQMPLDQESANLVFSKLVDDRSEMVRQRAVVQLGRCLTPDATSHLKRIATNDTDADVRRTAVEQLARPDSVCQPTELVSYLKDSDLTVAKSALKGLQQKTGKQVGLDIVAWRRELNLDGPQSPTNQVVPDKPANQPSVMQAGFQQ